MDVAKAKFTLVALVVAAVFWAAPHAAAVLPEHPHIEGSQAIVLEVESAPSAQAMRGGEGLSAVG